MEYVVWNGIRLNNTVTPVCIEIHLDTTLSYNEHIQKIKQLNVRNIIIVKHANSRWIIGRMPTLTTCCLALCCSFAEYSCPVRVPIQASSNRPHMTAAETSKDVSCQHTSAAAGRYCSCSHYENCCKPHGARKTDDTNQQPTSILLK